jgi:hypothetical protein
VYGDMITADNLGSNDGWTQPNKSLDELRKYFKISFFVVTPAQS